MDLLLSDNKLFPVEVSVSRLRNESDNFVIFVEYYIFRQVKRSL